MASPGPIRIDLPVSQKAIRKLKAGDEVLLSGRVVTARDSAHKHMIEHRPEWLKPLLKNSIIYHCGPVMKQVGDRWEVVAAGPTTSIREEPYEADIMKMYGIRGVIGKGGMGPKTLAGCRKYGAVYLHAIGGLAAVLAKAVVEVEGVHMLEELGVPEAFWLFRVKDFPAVVTMDSHGTSLHATMKEKSEKIAAKLIGLKPAKGKGKKGGKGKGKKGGKGNGRKGGKGKKGKKGKKKAAAK
jgi:fumarate hydratase class I